MTDRSTAARLDTQLQSCVECGLCLPHCATFLASGDEVMSPRGRLLLLRDTVNDPDGAVDPAIRAAFDTCLGCMACTATCPSGVAFELLEYLGRSVEPRGPQPAAMLDRPRLLRGLDRVGRLARWFLARALGRSWRRHLTRAPRPLPSLSRLLGTMPTSPRADRDLVDLLDRCCLAAKRSPGDEPVVSVVTPPPPALEVTWFAGCADSALLPATSRRLQDMLRAMGCTMNEPVNQACCGAIAIHTGRPERARVLQARNEAAFASSDADHVVVMAAGCGRELRQSGATFAERVTDAVVLLDRLAPSRLGPVPLRVAIHDPCHARHGQDIVAEPRRLLRRIPGLELVEPGEAEVCCGGAGVYSLRHRHLAARMGARKADQLLATDCDLVVTSNAGCLGQIADGLALSGCEVPILPLSDLVWYAWQGGHSGQPGFSRKDSR